jgi:uncharacterized protein (DUF302 family)
LSFPRHSVTFNPEETAMEYFEYTVETQKSFDDAVAAVEERSKDKGFGVLHIHDVKATLAAKGFERTPLKIIEICNARFAHDALAKDIRVGLMLPCRISVYLHGSKIFISAFRPVVIKEMLPEAGLDRLADEVDKIICGIVDAAK